MPNRYLGDPDLVGLFRFESGLMTKDSARGKTLTNVNTVAENTTDELEGLCCADFEAGSSQYFGIANASLDSDFILKAGNYLSLAGAFRLESYPSAAGYCLVAKHNPGTGKRGLALSIYEDSGTYYFRAVIGYNSGADFEAWNVALAGLALNNWYRYVWTYDRTSKAWALWLYDVIGDTDYTSDSGTSTNTLNLIDADFTIGAYLNSSTITWAFDGEQDDITVFKRCLTSTEKDAIFAGTFGPSMAPNVLTLESRLISHWRLEDGALTTDERGLNALTNNSVVASDTYNCLDGAASGLFDNTAWLSRADADLHASTPLKSGTSNKVLTAFCRFYRERTGTEENLISKYDYGAARSFRMAIGSGDNIFIAIGYNSGNSAETHGGSYTTVAGRWYSLGMWYDDSDKSCGWILYDHAERTIQETIDTTATNNIHLSAADFIIGAEASAGGLRFFKGNIDEALLFNAKLTQAEIKRLITGNYFIPNPAKGIGHTNAPTVYAGVSVTPDPVKGIGHTVQPSVIYGSVSVTPAAAAKGIGHSASPTVYAPDIGIPAPVKGLGHTVDPTVILGTVTVTPDPATGIGTVGADVEGIMESVAFPDRKCRAIGHTNPPTVILGDTIASPDQVKGIGHSASPLVLERFSFLKAASVDYYAETEAIESTELETNAIVGFELETRAIVDFL